MRGWGRDWPGLLPLDGAGAVYGRCAWVLSAVWDAAKDTRGLGWREFAGTWVGWRVSGRGVPSGRGWNRLQPGQGATELVFPGPAIWKMQGQPACRAGEPYGHREELPPEGLGGYHLLAQADARCPVSQVVGDHSDPPARRRWRRTGKAAGSAFLGHPRESPRGRIHIMTLVRIRWGINRVHPHRVSAQAVSRARARRRSGCLPISTGKNSRRYRQD